MIELIIAVYGGLCWLLFKKWKVIPTNTYTVCTALLIGVVFLALLGILLLRYQPQSTDARMYVMTTPIVPEVRGIVREVMAEPGVPMKQGDPLFQIDPAPYQFEVDRLEASLESASTNTAQLEEKVSAANAAVEQSAATVERVGGELALAETELSRTSVLLEKQTVSRQRYDTVKQNVDGLRAQLSQARAATKQAQAQLRDLQLGLDSNAEGQTPEVRQIVASLNKARWELEQTTVRAPADGFPAQMSLQPGQMASNLPLAPVMVFVHARRAWLVASFPQNSAAVIQPGHKAELAFKSHPWRIFGATVSKVSMVLPEGQLQVSGNLRNVTSTHASGRIPIVFEYGDDVSNLALPAGSQATVAVYTEHFHFLSLIRKIVLRIKSWENFIFLP